MTTLPATHHPDVPTHAEWSDDGQYWALSLLCPYCGRVHHHGGGDDSEPDYGHRSTHCLTGSHPDYHLIPGPPDMPKPRSRGRRRVISPEVLA